MRRSAVALHRGAQQREPTEHGVERIERRGAGHDQDPAAVARSACSSSATERAEGPA